MFPAINNQNPNLVIYFGIFAILASGLWFFKKQQSALDLKVSSDLFMRILNNEEEYKSKLLEKQNIYSELTKLFFFSKTADGISQEFHRNFTGISQGAWSYPNYVISQIMVVKLLSSENVVSSDDLRFLVKARSPWEPMVNWIKFAVNEEDNHGTFTNAYFIENRDQDVENLIESDSRCIKID